MTNTNEDRVRALAEKMRATAAKGGGYSGKTLISQPNALRYADDIEALLSDKQALERDFESLRTSFANRNELIEGDPFPLWMQIVAAYDNQRKAAEASLTAAQEREAKTKEVLTYALHTLEYAEHYVSYQPGSMGAADMAETIEQIRALLTPPLEQE